MKYNKRDTVRKFGKTRKKIHATLSANLKEYVTELQANIVYEL